MKHWFEAPAEDIGRHTEALIAYAQSKKITLLHAKPTIAFGEGSGASVRVMLPSGENGLSSLYAVISRADNGKWVLTEAGHADPGAKGSDPWPDDDMRFFLECYFSSKNSFVAYLLKSLPPEPHHERVYTGFRGLGDESYARVVIQAVTAGVHDILNGKMKTDIPPHGELHGVYSDIINLTAAKEGRTDVTPLSDGLVTAWLTQVVDEVAGNFDARAANKEENKK